MLPKALILSASEDVDDMDPEACAPALSSPSLVVVIESMLSSLIPRVAGNGGAVKEFSSDGLSNPEIPSVPPPLLFEAVRETVECKNFGVVSPPESILSPKCELCNLVGVGVETSEQKLSFNELP